MQITVNGEERAVEDNLTIVQLVAVMGLNSGPVAVERNGEVVRRAEHASTQLQPGDRVEIVHFVGGG